MTDRELMQQALDALVHTNAEWKSLADSGYAGFWKAENQDYYVQCKIAIDALRTRLAQPEQEWQGLTDEEILEEYRQSYGDDGDLTDVYFARVIEAKLKEKNT